MCEWMGREKEHRERLGRGRKGVVSFGLWLLSSFSGDGGFDVHERLAQQTSGEENS